MQRWTQQARRSWQHPTCQFIGREFHLSSLVLTISFISSDFASVPRMRRRNLKLILTMYSVSALMSVPQQSSLSEDVDNGPTFMQLLFGRKEKRLECLRRLSDDSATKWSYSNDGGNWWLKLKLFLKRNLSTSGLKIVGKKIKDKLAQGKDDS
jgi:hypothetical protein